MAMVKASSLRVGEAIIFNKEPFRLVGVMHLTPGNLRAMVQTKMKNIRTGVNAEHRFRSDDTVEKAQLEQQEAEFLYAQGDDYVFMNTETYDQIQLSKETLGDNIYYLLPNTKLQLEIFEGNPVGIQPPMTMEFQVVETTPQLKGATASNSPKPAKLETGLTVMVPNFIETGERVKIDTRENKYLERAK
jgi:elongation factor P